MNFNMQNGFQPYDLYYYSLYNSFFNQMIIPFAENDLYSQNTFLNMNQGTHLWHQSSSPRQVPACLNSKVKTNIVLTKKQEVQQKVDTEGESKSENLKEKKKALCLQKENRNVSSNLLRIFFKNILEVGSYEDLINSLLRKFQIEMTSQQFYDWLEKFKVNFKNYIKPTEIKKILTAKHCKPFQKIFRTLLRNYMNQMGVLHCLTSKRIDQSCTKKHIEGLRRLLSLGN